MTRAPGATRVVPLARCACVRASAAPRLSRRAIRGSEKNAGTAVGPPRRFVVGAARCGDRRGRPPAAAPGQAGSGGTVDTPRAGGGAM
ncbi:hypothetical protein X961_4443 [Burkholderia pseudomallei MSHR5613]|nr:hypothetical protein X961_4443 [Burkholderia pseudomallei MSHR5613]